MTSPRRAWAFATLGALLAAGCGKPGPAVLASDVPSRRSPLPSASPPDTGAGAENGVVVEGGRVKAIPGVLLNPASVPPPAAEDAAFAARLAPEIREAGLEFLKERLGGRDLGYALYAARQSGDYVLLCYVGKVRDGDATLVYSIKRKKVLGPFFWYGQG